MRISFINTATRRRVSSAAAALGRSATAFAEDRGGSVAVIAAVVFPVLIGGMGLGAEVGYWYMTERKLQHAADLAAYAAAVRLGAGDEGEELDAVALQIATNSGFRDVGSTDIKVYHPPISGDNIGDPTMVEVLLTEEIERAFSGIFKQDDVVVRGRAVGRVFGAPSPACLIALAQSGSNTLEVTGSGSIVLNNCVAVANTGHSQGIFAKGSGSLTAKCVYSQNGLGYAQKASSLVTECEPEIQEDTAVDPYDHVVPPQKSATCYTPANNNQPTIPAAPTRVIDGINVWDLCKLHVRTNLNLAAGLYIVYSGDVTDNGQNTVKGTGVTFFLTSKASTPSDYSRIDLNGTHFELTAPTTGRFSGLVFFGEAANTEVHEFGGNSDIKAQGALRFPGGTLDFGGGSGSGGCVQLIANKISFNGNGNIAFGHDCAAAGTSTASAGAAASVKLSE